MSLCGVIWKIMNDNAPVIIGIMGHKGAGKDTLGDRLISSLIRSEGCLQSGLEYVNTYAFADRIKNVCIELFDLNYDDCHGPSENRSRNTNWYWHECNDKLIKQFDANPHDPITVRELLQIIGTEIFRKHFSDKIWIKLIKKDIMSSDDQVSIITDVRLKRELQSIKEWGGYTIGIKRPQSYETPSHKTEKEMEEMFENPDNAFDFFFKNNGPLNDMNNFADTVVKRIGRKND